MTHPPAVLTPARRSSLHPAERDSWAKEIRATILFLMPVAAYFTAWLSTQPGASGQLYLFRLLTSLCAAAGLVNFSNWMGSLGRYSRFFVVMCLIVASEAVLWWLSPALIDVRKAQTQATAALGAAGIVLLAQGRPSSLRLLQMGIAFGAVAEMLIVLLEWRTGIRLENLAGRAWIFGTSLAGTFPNPNNLAAHASLMIAVLILFGTRYRSLRLPLWGCAALLAGGALQTQSRTIFASIALAALIAMLYGAHGKIGVLIPRILLASISALILVELVGSRLTFNAAGYFGSSAASDAIRFDLANRALQLISGSFGIGIGPGAFELKQLAEGNLFATSIHNSFLEMGVAYGLAPALLLLFLTITVTRTAWRCLTRRSADTFQAAITLSAIMCVVLGALVASSVLADASWWMALSVAVLGADSLAPRRSDAY